MDENSTTKVVPAAGVIRHTAHGPWNQTLLASLEHHVTEYIRQRDDVTAAEDYGLSTVATPSDGNPNDGLFHSPLSETTPDPLLVVAIAIFAVGAILIAIGLARLVYFISEPKGEKRQFRYVLRYTDYTSSGKPEYDRQSDGYSDWI